MSPGLNELRIRLPVVGLSCVRKRDPYSSVIDSDTGKYINILKPRQNGRRFADGSFSDMSPITDKTSLVRIMAWLRQAIIWTNDALGYEAANDSNAAPTNRIFFKFDSATQRQYCNT